MSLSKGLSTQRILYAHSSNTNAKRLSDLINRFMQLEHMLNSQGRPQNLPSHRHRGTTLMEYLKENWRIVTWLHPCDTSHQLESMHTPRVLESYNITSIYGVIWTLWLRHHMYYCDRQGTGHSIHMCCIFPRLITYPRRHTHINIDAEYRLRKLAV